MGDSQEKLPARDGFGWQSAADRNQVGQWVPAAGQAACPATVPRERDGALLARAAALLHKLGFAGTSLASCRVCDGFLGCSVSNKLTWLVLLLESCHFGLI